MRCCSSYSSSFVLRIAIVLYLHLDLEDLKLFRDVHRVWLVDGGRLESRVQIPYARSAAVRGDFVFSVDDFGARGDGSSDDTEALANAWKEACNSKSEAVLIIPQGKEYLVKQINLGCSCKSKLTFLILGTIVAPLDPEAWDGLNPQRWLYFHGGVKETKGLVIQGGGTIDGMGHKWWELSCKYNSSNPCRKSPTAVTFHRLKNLEVHELTIMNSQRIHLAFTNCLDVRASRLNIVSPEDSPNTDGIHISSSTSVLVEDSVIGTGDDCISVVGNSSDISIRNIACGPGHGISVGSLGEKNSTSFLSDVRVEGSFLSNTKYGARIKTWQGGHGEANGIIFKNVFLKNVSNPIVIDQFYCDSSQPCQNQTSAVRISNVSFDHIIGTSATKKAMSFACSDTCPCDHIHLNDIFLSLESRHNNKGPISYCWKVSGTSYGTLHPPSCFPSSELDGGFLWHFPLNEEEEQAL